MEAFVAYICIKAHYHMGLWTAVGCMQMFAEEPNPDLWCKSDKVIGCDPREALWQLCKNFIRDNKINCAETVHQTDRVITNAYEFIENICDVVGYQPDEEPETQKD